MRALCSLSETVNEILRDAVFFFCIYTETCVNVCSDLQVLEQDRHALRRKLAATASEADSRLLELQADVRELQRAVEEREAALRSTEREKAALVAELTEQNTRLAAQLKEVRNPQHH